MQVEIIDDLFDMYVTYFPKALEYTIASFIGVIIGFWLKGNLHELLELDIFIKAIIITAGIVIAYPITFPMIVYYYCLYCKNSMLVCFYLLCFILYKIFMI